MTDGRATRAFSHHLPPLRNLGIEIFTIGIGNRIDQSELDLIASTPPSEHVLFLNNIQLINNFISRLTTSSCRSKLIRICLGVYVTFFTCFLCRLLPCRRKSRGRGFWNTWSGFLLQIDLCVYLKACANIC